MSEGIPEAVAAVRIKFTDGEIVDFSFASHGAAREFHGRSQRRSDAFSVGFVDLDLLSAIKSV